MQKRSVKPIPASKIRAILPEKINPVKINSKQMMRDVITDYIVQNMYSTHPLFSKRHKQIKYEPISVALTINSYKQTFDIQLLSILQKYVQREKHKFSKEGGIEPFIKDILDFIDKLENNDQFRNIEIQGSFSFDKILEILILKHIKERERKAFQGQYEEAKENIYTKYKKVDFPEFQQLNSSGLTWNDLQKDEYQNLSMIKSKNAISILEKEEFNHKKKSVPTKSKLKQLIDSCNIFQHPQKVQALRQQKLVSYFCQNEKEFLDTRHEIRTKVENKQTKKSVGHFASLQDWIVQISVSEMLFKKKYDPKPQKGQKKKNQHRISGLTSSDDDETA